MKRWQIVLVEDDKIMSDYTSEILKDDYDVYVINDGLMAMKVIELKKPDLILLDLILPSIHGFEILQKLKQHEEEQIRSIPVIIVTGVQNDEDIERGLELGANDYIPKPINKNLLKIKIRNYLDILQFKNNMQNIIDDQLVDIRNIHRTLIGIISLLVGERDGSTGTHSTKIMGYMRAIFPHINPYARKSIPEHDDSYIITLSALHDIGKIAMPDEILLKSSNLTEEEFNCMKNHTTRGATILKRAKEMFGDTLPQLKYAIEMAEYHHENYDGTGYPHGLAGDEIPLTARVLRICDIYDALTSKRHYKDAYGHHQAFEIIVNGDGRTNPGHFDPYVLNAFILAEQEFFKLYTNSEG